MKLRQWLEANDRTLKRAAGEMGFSYNVLHRYATGERLPAPAAMRMIFGYTDGAVTPNDFHALPEPRPWLVALARPERRNAFLRLGWQPWPDPEAAAGGLAASGLMRRKARPEDGWQEIMAELAYLTGPPTLNAPLDPGALVAPRPDPN